MIDATIDDHSPNLLVTLTGTEIDHRLVREAGAYATGRGSQLVLLRVMSEREFAGRQGVYARIKDLPEYTLVQAEERGRLSAARIGHEALVAVDVEFTAVGVVGSEADQIVDAAQAYDCAHVFLAERPRSLLRRLFARDLVSGSRAQFRRARHRLADRVQWED
ncbi:universal stress protein [Haladaptatus sp. SPP-AMP-3]|uniref:universal stress protein n=1 Tax=Haladaptatus sp. SPP-AMP-3 TaxID=3121295 RepID=UPI003C2E85F1